MSIQVKELLTSRLTSVVAFVPPNGRDTCGRALDRFCGPPTRLPAQFAGAARIDREQFRLMRRF
jgi:hypothetical protein